MNKSTTLVAIRAYLTLFSVAAVLTMTVPSTMAQDTRPEFVIAILGDSYASGEGSPDVHGKHSLGGDLFAAECLPGSPYGPCFSEKWWSPDSWFSNRLAVFPQGDDPGWQDDARRCHRSSKGPGAHAAMQIAARFPDIKITVLDFACGGSKITDGLLFGWPGPEPPQGASNLPSQIEALEDYVKGTQRHIDAIVMNIGGNDTRFADLIIQCIILNVTNDCADDPLLHEIGELLKDEPTPRFPNTNATLRARYEVLDAAFRNVSRPEGVSTLVSGRPDEVYLTGPPNPSHDAPPATNLAANSENFCDGTQSNDPDYRNVKFGESVAMENLVGGSEISMNRAMQKAARRHGWIFIDMFDIARDHGVCANAQSFFRTNTDALRIQGDEGLRPPLPGLGPFFISPGIAHQNEAGYAARADLIAKVVGEQVRMRFRAATLFVDRVEVGTASKVTFRWNDPSPLHLPETRWELEFVKREVINPIRVFSDGVDTLSGDLTEMPFANGRTLMWRIQESGEFTARVRGCRSTSTGFYCGPFSNAVTVVTFVPDIPVVLKKLPSLIGPLNRSMIKVGWQAGPNTPNSVRYEVAHGPYGGRPCPPPLRSDATCGFGMVNPTIRSTTSTTFTGASYAPEKDVFQVRACSAAGCSRYTPELVTEYVDLGLPVSLDIPDLRFVTPPSPVDKPTPR